MWSKATKSISWDSPFNKCRLMQTMGRTVRIGCSSGFWGDTPTAVPQLLYAGQLQVRGECRNQYCGSMTFWCGSGSRSADPCLWLMDPDPYPGSGSCYFRHRPSRCQQKTNLFLIFSAKYGTFWRYIYIIFSKIKSQKESQNSRTQGFSYYFCMMIEGSGSGRPWNMWIRRIRIRNTGRNFWSVFRILIHSGARWPSSRPLCRNVAVLKVGWPVIISGREFFEQP